MIRTEGMTSPSPSIQWYGAQRRGGGIGAGKECRVIVEKEQRLSLSGGQTLLITRGEPVENAVEQAEDLLQIVGPKGRPMVTIRVSEQGVSVELASGPVMLNVEGDLRIEAERLQLHARDQLSLTSGRDAQIFVEETLSTTAKRQAVTATRGDVRLVANDDVRMDGERIRMNC
jgi:hypothetical protein